MNTPDLPDARHVAAPDHPVRLPSLAGLDAQALAAHRLTLGGVPPGAAPLVLAHLAASATPGAPVIHVARDARAMWEVAGGLDFYMPGLKSVVFPAWDCLPYDRVSPNTPLVAERLAALSRLAPRAAPPHTHGAQVILTSVNAMIQKVPPRSWLVRNRAVLKPGAQIRPAGLARWLRARGYTHVSSVMDMGDFAIRGGILDLFCPGRSRPARLDFFGDRLESIRSFDPETQLTDRTIERLRLLPVSELSLERRSIQRFRALWLARFGVDPDGDPLYAAVSEGRRVPGIEHWLGCFHEQLDTFLDYCAPSRLVFEYGADAAITERFEQIETHYQERLEALDMPRIRSGDPYKPLPPAALYVTRDDWQDCLRALPVTQFSPFREADAPPALSCHLPGREGRNFAAGRAMARLSDRAVSAHHDAHTASSGGAPGAFVDHLRRILAEDAPPRIAILACASAGSRERLGSILTDQGFHDHYHLPDGDLPALWLRPGRLGLAILPLERGFEMGPLAVFAEADVLGDRLIRATRRARRDTNVIRAASALAVGDLVVHSDHGVARFDGLRTVMALDVPHDCAELTYAGGDRLYLPVENIDLLSRYGSGGEVALDRLGGTAWQARKARVRKRILEMAGELIATAARRALRPAQRIDVPDSEYNAFCARFSFEETRDQGETMAAIVDDLQSGRAMDRLVCGDVGFGKTEIALRAAFLVAMSGCQVAIIVPTTLLCRQHFETFSRRFCETPVTIAPLSRLQGAKANRKTRDDIAGGRVNIVIGTHALLSESIQFRDLALLIVDEEQRFGVRHKERLKALKDSVHVLTLSATPIPRTLQLAMSGVRDMSLIATPPVDRLAVRSFITPFDPLAIRNALRREHNRGGQSFFVCPQIRDLDDITAFLDEHLSDLKYIVAHGQMPPGRLDDAMRAFYDGHYDILVSTTIVESGLDIPRANTLIVTRADMFGLSQLYQLRGRVGRSRRRAFALFAFSPDKPLNETAARRLRVLQSLDTLGAGFQLASHDLDIRGAGNLLGDAQSGHVREVGFELYQNMLEEAVAGLREGDGAAADGQWSPQINMGIPVLIPEAWIRDLPLRLELYRRLGDIADETLIDSFAVELTDRFGPPPDEINWLLQVVRIKCRCRRANVARIEAGARGAVISLRGGRFAAPHQLAAWLAGPGAPARIRHDHTIVLGRNWPTTGARLAGLLDILGEFAKMTESAAPDRSAPGSAAQGNAAPQDMAGTN